MEDQTRVVEYKCPCCGAGLAFGPGTKQLKCEYCDNTFDMDTVRAFNESKTEQESEEFQWEEQQHQEWSEAEQEHMQAFLCPSCGGEILTEETTAATFCPYCGNPTIMPGRVSRGLKPDAIIPFQKSREDAKEAFLKLCKGKPLLPGMFTREQQVEKITGMYVPFWLYDCSGELDGSYQATRVHCWSDSKYNYTKTEHFLLQRNAEAAFAGIPMDGSSKMDDTFMESIEPFDYHALVDFDTAYLSGYLADKYDVASESGEARVRQRVDQAMDELLQNSLMGYATVVPTSRQLRVNHGKARYVLLPVWMLNTKYNGKIYTFAMNGQTGKMTGSFPISTARAAAWFAGICAGVTALVSLVQWLML